MRCSSSLAVTVRASAAKTSRVAFASAESPPPPTEVAFELTPGRRAAMPAPPTLHEPLGVLSSEVAGGAS